ncbi:hypothetical protein [Fuerstiella marisgermanici]|uniref:Uncharacterized protein n=1 Tax=Fuerstiella marisgermanici TaxID=1891926 RepID=A0A1P8WCI6_9PLAN|nr:hypothetical protein [Fuerstiella marisgermanici]APZ91759.1 hypothetical protein Fuma_01350 [Fuerstiella marisgermanici]
MKILRALQARDAAHPRRAIVTVMVLVVLILMSGLVAEFVRRAVTDRRQMQRELEHRQTRLLAVAGLERAQRMVAADTEYTGETWQIADGVFNQTKSAVVKISISDGMTTATAQYPTDQEIPFKVTRTARLVK